MKYELFIGFMLLLLTTSCEEVVDIETPSEEPRLIVEGLIRVDVAEAFIPVEIKVSISDNFFNEIPVTNLDNIIISYTQFEDGVPTGTLTSTLAEVDPGSGIYVPDPDFFDDQRIPTLVTFGDDVEFELLINHEDRTYFAETKYVPTVPIISVQQGNGKFLSEDDTELLVLFADDPSRDDYYLFDFDFDEFLVTNDQFYQGQLFQFSYFYDRQFEPGTEIDVKIMGADQNFYNYMDLLIEQSGETQGIFQTPVATVKGNVFDITDIDNIDLGDNVQRPDLFPLGYFAVVQEHIQKVTIQ